MKKRNFLIVTTFFWVILIFSFSLQPADVSSDTSMDFARKTWGAIFPHFLEHLDQMSQEELDIFQFIIRKCAHFTEYFILGILSLFTAVESKVKKIFGISLVFCASVACIDETLQLFVSGRSGRIQDVLLDSMGAATGILIMLCLLKIMKNRRMQ